MTFRPARRLLLSTLLAAVAASPAMAHAILVHSTPAQGATVQPGETAIVLRYNSRVDAARSRVTLTGPGLKAAVLGLTAEDGGAVLAARATLAPGRYTLRWQVLAIDGHITRGDVTFKAAAP